LRNPHSYICRTVHSLQTPFFTFSLNLDYQRLLLVETGFFFPPVLFLGYLSPRLFRPPVGDALNGWPIRLKKIALPPTFSHNLYRIDSHFAIWSDVHPRGSHATPSLYDTDGLCSISPPNIRGKLPPSAVSPCLGKAPQIHPLDECSWFFPFFPVPAYSSTCRTQSFRTTYYT